MSCSCDRYYEWFEEKCREVDALQNSLDDFTRTLGEETDLSVRESLEVDQYPTTTDLHSEYYRGRKDAMLHLCRVWDQCKGNYRE